MRDFFKKKSGSEKYLKNIEFSLDSTNRCLEVKLKDENLNIHTAHKILEKRCGYLQLFAEKFKIGRKYQIEITSTVGLIGQELVQQAEKLLAPRQEFFSKYPKPAVTFNFPLSQTVNHSAAWFMIGETPIKKAPEIIDLTENENFEEFKSQLRTGANLKFTVDDIKAIKAAEEDFHARENLHKRKVEKTENSQAYKVQKTSEESRINHCDSEDEADQFIDQSNFHP